MDGTPQMNAELWRWCFDVWYDVWMKYFSTWLEMDVHV